MKLAFPGLMMLIGGVVVLIAAALMLYSSRLTSGRGAVMTRVVAGLVTAALFGCVLSVSWFESRYS